MKTTLIALCLSISVFAHATTALSIRLEPARYDQQSQVLYVNVELRNTGASEIHLADQNYRFFYDAEALSLQEMNSYSDLPQDIYQGIRFTEVMEGLEADHINYLTFDDDFGFVNFDIEMIDPKVQGLRLHARDEWQRVAVLQFDVIKPDELSQIVWSEQGVTDRYASAYVEISEWVKPNDTEPVKVVTYVNGTFDKKEFVGDVDLTISPNPAIDFAKVDFGHPLKNDVIIQVIDITGKQIQSKVAYTGASSIHLSVAQLPAGKYVVDIIEKTTNTRIKREKLIKVK